MPPPHSPGHAQADFGETFGVIGGIECKLHCVAMALPHSNAFFTKAYPANPGRFSVTNRYKEDLRDYKETQAAQGRFNFRLSA